MNQVTEQKIFQAKDINFSEDDKFRIQNQDILIGLGLGPGIANQ